ncbi:hypothetical protein FSP39_007106 [Pinctada imbricata]|uniref:VWFA and cache domain-containing protein 1-like protein n=1 Tax=Pinctada imbricata TaxID=66713 RepID=A0AA88XXM1_PINIB|nr:hypothetical protein FSP39_007106 [Pinctada imbricata]
MATSRTLLCYFVNYLVIYLSVWNQIVSTEDSEWLKGIKPGKLRLKNLGERDKSFSKLLSDDGYFADTRQEKPDPKVLGGVHIDHEAQQLSAQLRWLSNEEIGITNMQAIYDSLPYDEKEKNLKGTLDKIASRLKHRIKNYLKVLNTNKITAQNLYKFHVKQPITSSGINCCDLPLSQLSQENQYGCEISRETSCDLYPHNMKENSFNPGRSLFEVWKGNMQYFPSLKWQYFISVDGIHTEYPGNRFKWSKDCSNVHDSRHSAVNLATAQPQAKHIVIVMDHGNSLSTNQLRTAKGIAKYLLGSLSEKDRVGIFGLASGPTFPRDPRDDSCLPNSLVPLTYEASLFFSNFIDNLEKEDSSTNHSLGFETAFDMIENMIHRSKGFNIENPMIIYISRGLLSSIAEAKDVMETIAIHNGRLQHKVVIDTFAVIDDGKPIMLEKSFLQDIAEQNFDKYKVQYRSNHPVTTGMMSAINSTKDLIITVGKFYQPLNRTVSEFPVFSMPYIDEADNALTMSISQPCLHGDEFFGVMGVDLHMEDIVQDVTYYSKDTGSYSFIINNEGYTIMHPSFSRPVKTRIQPMHTDIWHFENYDGFARVRSDMLNMDEGERTLYVQPDGKNNVTNIQVYAKFYWKKIESTPFIVVLKVLSQTNEYRQLENLHVSSDPQLVYHRLDLVPTSMMCLHRNQLATPEISTVFLSAKSFLDPFEHLSNKETKRMVQNYIAYLKDDTRLITNPGLKENVRNDVAATGRINTEWLRRYHTSVMKENIVRRFIATPSGVLRSFPGALLDKAFDPTKRKWYTRALKFPGHVTLTPPYLDVLGSGYITTISGTIFEGKRAALHSPSDPVVAVMGMDITLGHLHKLLYDNIAVCRQATVRCFIMDDRGYLVAHPSLVEPNGKGPLQEQHITHQEPLVANDILNHRHFVHKTLCNKYNDRTIQRYYHFNTSLDGILTNLVHGEQCARYQITKIPGTNAFLGIVNHTCDTATAFCPCSMFDRLCLNCNLMEQIVCECPCECPLEMNFCTGELLQEDDRNPSCTAEPELESVAQFDLSIFHELRLCTEPTNDKTCYQISKFEEIKQCHEPKCSQKRDKMSCMSTQGCAWCERQKLGLTNVRRPYCADQRVCFGGVEEAPTPYGDQIIAMAEAEEQKSTKSTPVGPVAGGIMGCFLVLALGVYCYRHHIHGNSHQYISTLPETAIRTSHYYEEEPQEPGDDLSSGHTNFVLATFENPASVSPYRVNTSYRRPAGGDSDHGYSTMTPHEDSEHASLPCLEPLIIGKDRYKPGSLSVVKTPGKLPPPPSSSRRSRSPTPPQTRYPGYQPIPEQTVLPCQTVINTPIPEVINNVIAKVQVHMVDTH